VLLDSGASTKTTTQNACGGSVSNIVDDEGLSTNDQIIIGVVVPVGVILIIVGSILLTPKVKTWWAVHRSNIEMDKM